MPIRGLFFRMLAAAAALMLPTAPPAQVLCRQSDPVSYTVTFANAAHHEAEIVARFTGVSADPLEIRMSRSSPGRYALMEFSRNVSRFRAVNGRGVELPVARPDPHQWNVSGHDGTVEIRYTLFGDALDGTNASIDLTHAHLNIPASFAWARGMEQRPVEVEFRPPPRSGWKASTQLFPTHHPAMFTAPDLQYFMDSPVELSDHTVRSWRGGGAGADGSPEFRIALHHGGTEAEADALAAIARRVTGEARAVIGEYPAFDNSSYVFLFDLLPWAGGDGMEHRNSTVITGTRTIRDHASGLAGTIAHEFFHVWNVERIRPKGLEPFDFEKANMAAELWFAEGVTNYYDRLIRARAGLLGLDRFAESLGANLDEVRSSPARESSTAAELSRTGGVLDGGSFGDRMNLVNRYLSYYSFGDAIGTALDLTLRSRFPGRTLDDLMRRMWEKHGRTGAPYTNADIEARLGELTGDPVFARDFFSRYVEGHETVDYARLLAPAGFLLRPRDSAAASFGRASLEYRTDGAVLAAGPPSTSAWYRAGLDRGDTILTIAGTVPASAALVDSLCAKRRPGDRLEVEYIQRGRRLTANVELVTSERMEVVTFERAGLPLSEAGKIFRGQWLGARDPDAPPAPVRYCRTCSREYPFEYEFCHYDGKSLAYTR